MIALDTSALVAIVREEEEAERFAALIARGDAIIGTPTLLETHMVLSSRLEGGPEDFFVRLLENVHVRPVAFSLNMFQLAQGAFDRYGKGRHPKAALNFGDCLSYAVAKYHDVPLLYKGDDFRHTDLRSAHP